jgi:hypothetical protein
LAVSGREDQLQPGMLAGLSRSTEAAAMETRANSPMQGSTQLEAVEEAEVTGKMEW